MNALSIENNRAEIVLSQDAPLPNVPQVIAAVPFMRPVGAPFLAVSPSNDASSS
jgi:hypothetical protein